MSEETQNTEAVVEATQELKLNGIYAFKVGMSSVYSEAGINIPVTVLRYEPWIVSQLKTQETDGYSAVQIACRSKKAKRTTKAEANHLKKAGFENGAYFSREIRQALPEGVEVGQKVSINSFQVGDKLKITSKSKGRGFTGVVKRHNFAGGPASHGSGFHRRPGSIGNCEYPGRVMAGRKMPGHFGDDVVTVKNVELVSILPEENVLLVKGPVPGARQTLVKLVRA